MAWTNETYFVPEPIKKVKLIKINLSEDDLKIIRNFTDIQEAYILKDKLSILTKTINMSNHELGQFKIEIKNSFENDSAISAIYICNQTRTVDVDRFHETDGRFVFHHPHIWAEERNTERTTICFGNIKRYIQKMLIAKEPIILISTILEYLKNGYGWGHDKEEYLKCWPEVNKENKNVVKGLENLE